MMSSGARRLSAVALVLLGCGLLSVAQSSRVAMYMSDENGVVDLKWDQGPSNLAAQLVQLGFNVEPSTDNQPNLGAGAPGAYVIPAQNGPEFYDQTENMEELADYVSRGGLVVVLDSNTGRSEALKSFVAKALGYQGEWDVCKHFVTNARTSVGAPTLNKRASSFLAGSWPATLEDAQVTSVHTWCRHSDANAISTPLYTVLKDDMKCVAQAFSKAGNPGAVVWLGYSWKDGVQENWGELLHKIISEFSARDTAAVEAVEEDDEDSVESLIETVADAAADAASVSRRFLATPSYISPAPSASVTAITIALTVTSTTNKTQAEICDELKASLNLSSSSTCLFTSYSVTITPAPGRRAMLQGSFTISFVVIISTTDPSGTLVAANTLCASGTLLPNTTQTSCTVSFAAAPPSPSPPSPIPVIVVSPVNFSPVPATSPPSPVSPSPSPSPTPSPSPIVPRVPFTYKTAQGTWGNVTGVVVWYGTPAFKAQRKPKSALNMLSLKLAACNPPTPAPVDGCYKTCPRTYQAFDNRKKDGIIQIPVYFKNAVRITKATIIQNWKPSLLKVELLAFAGVEVPSPQVVGEPIFEQAEDKSSCAVPYELTVPPSISHILDPVPENTVAALSKTAYGGVLLTFAQPARRKNAARVDILVFDGEALYASPDDFKSRRKD